MSSDLGPLHGSRGFLLPHRRPGARDANAKALACHRTQMTALIDDDDPKGSITAACHQQHFGSIRRSSSPLEDILVT